MRKLLIFVFSMIFLLKLVSAVNVGIVVTYTNGTDFKQCLGVDKDLDGYNILNKADLNIEWSDPGLYGHALCKINGVGDNISGIVCQWGDDYWGFFIVDGDSWAYSPVGWDAIGDCWNRDYSSWSGHYCAMHGDVLGFAYGLFGKEPNFYSYDDVCPNKLNVKDIKIYVDGDKESGTIDVKPESEIKIKVELENLYSDNEGIAIEDINVVGVIEDIDDGDDLEEESDDFDLDAGDDETAELEFEIPLEVDDDSYDLILTIEGTDENGLLFNHEEKYTIDVEKERHDIRFYKVELEDNELSCFRTTSLDVEIINMGKGKEDVILQIQNSALDINIKDSDIELDDDPFDSDSKYSNSYTIIVPDDAAAGTYSTPVKAKYGSKTETTKLDLIIKDCKAKSSTSEQKTETKQIQTEQIQQSIEGTENPIITAAAVEQTGELDTGISLGFIIPLVIGLNIIVIAVVTIIVFKKLRK